MSTVRQTEERLIAAIRQWTFPTASSSISIGNGASVVSPLVRAHATPLAPDLNAVELTGALSSSISSSSRGGGSSSGGGGGLLSAPPPSVSLSTVSEVVGSSGERVWELDVSERGRGRISKVQFRLSAVSCSLEAPEVQGLGIAVQDLMRPPTPAAGTAPPPMAASTRSDYSASLVPETVRRLTLRMIDAFGRSLLESSALLDLAQFENPDDLEYGEGDESMAAVLQHERQAEVQHQPPGHQTATSTSLQSTSEESSNGTFQLDGSATPLDVQQFLAAHRLSGLQRTNSIKRRSSLASTSPFAHTTTVPSIEVSHRKPQKSPNTSDFSDDAQHDGVRQLRADLLRNLQTEPGVDPMLLISDPAEVAQRIRSKIAMSRRSQEPSRNESSSPFPPSTHAALDDNQQHYQDLHNNFRAASAPPPSGDNHDSHNGDTTPTASKPATNAPPHSPRAEEMMRYLLTKYFADPTAPSSTTSNTDQHAKEFPNH